MSDPLSTDSSPPLPTGPGAAFTFLYYFSGAALITALFTAQTLGVGLGTGLPGQIALIGGLVGGSLGTIFNRTQTCEIPFTSRQAFTQTLETTLAEMGYQQSETQDGLAWYQRSPLQRLFSGDIVVQIQDHKAVLSSRAANIWGLRRRLTQQWHSTMTMAKRAKFPHLVGSKWTAQQPTCGWRHFQVVNRKNQGSWVFAELVAACDPQVRLWINAQGLKNRTLWSPGWQSLQGREASSS